jgi:hypothetical protein
MYFSACHVWSKKYVTILTRNITATNKNKDDALKDIKYDRCWTNTVFFFEFILLPDMYVIDRMLLQKLLCGCVEDINIDQLVEP